MNDAHRQQALEIIRDITEHTGDIFDSTSLVGDLGFDSLDAVELAMDIESWLQDLGIKNWAIPDSESDRWELVGDVLRSVKIRVNPVKGD